MQRYLRVLLPPEHFSVSDADGKTWLYLPHTDTPPDFEETQLEDCVSWKDQWSAETIEIDLSPYAATKRFYLNAGPGFGDLSHPTTRLTLALMAPLVKGRDVLDVGCGSGILSLAAALLGAKRVYGIDIDPEALLHAHENAQLNHLQIQFIQPHSFDAQMSHEPLILMNMIRTQQSEAWAALPEQHRRSALWVTSGVLATERKRYLTECCQRGWLLLKEQQEEQWLGFVFRMRD